MIKKHCRSGYNQLLKQSHPILLKRCGNAKMKILAVDIGTGTQDIFLYDSRLALENGLKLVLPSPTMIIHRRLQQATRSGQAVLLSGVIMGGGPSAWAAEAHIQAGLKLFATPHAARSFNDDLAAVARMGIHIVSEDESARLPESVLRLEMRDFDFDAIAGVFSSFGVSLSDLKAVAIAVFDHGNAPPEGSDRQFRFDYLDDRIRTHNRLSAFAYLSGLVPPFLTRLQAVASSATHVDAPVILMDTAPAAVLGSLYDPRVANRQRVLMANIGNFHTLAFRLGPRGIEGVFEHHTGFLKRDSLEGLLRSLAAGTLTHAEVFQGNGHGALLYDSQPLPLTSSDFNVAVTGPRRAMLTDSHLRPYFAVPFGDTMMAGC
ncbi:MAG: DUF1786 domain-containing protein, partial [Saprospiraceae bacterium]|nr:DUF1786 domain-containing protein [Saprospiraceae bacterium]